MLVSGTHTFIELWEHRMPNPMPSPCAEEFILRAHARARTILPWGSRLALYRSTEILHDFFEPLMLLFPSGEKKLLNLLTLIIFIQSRSFQ